MQRQCKVSQWRKRPDGWFLTAIHVPNGKFEYDDRLGSKAEVIQIQRGQTVDYDNTAAVSSSHT